jgi:hypothetical protein
MMYLLADQQQRSNTMTTKLQNEMLNKMAGHEWGSASPLEWADEVQVWASEIIETPKDKGVFTSLINAGLTYHFRDGRNSRVGMTESGFAAWKAITA